MAEDFSPAALVPRGFIVERAICEESVTVVTVRHARTSGTCPQCGRDSERVHSRYCRRLQDLPASGRPVRLMIVARRFYCDTVLCGRRIFTERFEKDILAPWGRRTARLENIVYHLGLALGGRPAASFARRLMLPVSNDTLLRAVRRRGSAPFAPPVVLGIDDWAWRRNKRYGTILCDLERRKTLALLSNREPATAEAWLSAQPRIEIIARDRGGSYALAAAKALPTAAQVADRWHLMENASRAFLDAVRKSMRQVRTAIGAATINPQLLTAAERIQYEGYLRREEVNAVVLGLVKEGVKIKEIARRTGYSRGLLRKIIRGQRSDIFRVRESSLEVHLQWLDGQWKAGHHNGAQLWRGLRGQGLRGSLRVVSEWAARRRKAEKADGGNLNRAPSARTIARLLTFGRDQLAKSESVTVAAIESGVPLRVEARQIIADFQAMIRTKSLADLEPWLARAKSSLVASFANGIMKDLNAVRAAITSSWSNGQTEGQITKLKLVKRQMAGENSIFFKRAS